MPAGSVAGQPTEGEEVAGGGAAVRAVLRRAFGERMLRELLDEFDERTRWLTLDPERVERLVQEARAAHKKFRTPLIDTLDDLTRPAAPKPAAPASKADELRAQARARVLGVTTRSTP